MASSESSHLLKQVSRFRQQCPYLARTPMGTLQELAQTKFLTMKSQHQQLKQIQSSADSELCQICPGNAGVTQDLATGKPTTALNLIAERCPVMSRALSLENEQRSQRQVAREIVDVVQQKANPVEPAQTVPKVMATPPPASQTKTLPTWPTQVDYEHLFKAPVERKRMDGSYRVFNNINRLADHYPKAETTDGKHITVWCSNDYLGMGRHPRVLTAMQETLMKFGAGAGGTRNIAGNSQLHWQLEQAMADLHKMEAGLLFSSCYIANDTTLATVGQLVPNMHFFSDSLNHASIIYGLRHSRCKKTVFRHNDLHHLEDQLKSVDLHQPKMICFESVYSMCGSVGKIEEIVSLAKKYQAMTFLDEVHAVGLYGSQGAGVTQLLEEKRGRRIPVDIITGTLGKAFGLVGGYLAGAQSFIDAIRSYAPGFIFTTSLPPVIVAGALASVHHLRSSPVERAMHQANVRYLRQKMLEADLPVLPNPSHILPVLVGDPVLTKDLSDKLLQQHEIYVQGINYPTVPRGHERLRFTPSPMHTKEQMDDLVNVLDQMWKEYSVKRYSDWLSTQTGRELAMERQQSPLVVAPSA